MILVSLKKSSQTLIHSVKFDILIFKINNNSSVILKNIYFIRIQCYQYIFVFAKSKRNSLERWNTVI